MVIKEMRNMPIKMWDVKLGMIKSVKYEDKKGAKILYLRNDISVDDVDKLKELEIAIDIVSKYIAGPKLEHEQGEKSGININLGAVEQLSDENMGES
jgi:hypothetical protein